MLANLVDYDAKYASNLLVTLLTYVEEGADIRRTAEQLAHVFNFNYICNFSKLCTDDCQEYAFIDCFNGKNVYAHYVVRTNFFKDHSGK